MSDTTTTTRRIHYVLSTHWDREWYESFQYYRFRLVQLLDRVIEGFESGRLRGPFQTDGQSIILEDYLEVRPERRAQVERLVREGKFAVGPWYVLPDEFLVSGESHIRNIRIGREVARELGAEPSSAGFVCDLFGHISQMPQIFGGFGITAGYLWRGLNLDHDRHLVWVGADGTELTCFKYGFQGYGGFALKVREGTTFDEKFDGDRQGKKLDEFIETEVRASSVDPILLFDGCDHQEWDQEFYTLISERLDLQGSPYTYIHSSLDAYQAEMLAQKDRISARFHGELREPGFTPDAGHQISGVLSSRAWIKQQNALCENLLCLWAEPFAALATTSLDTEFPEGFLNVAWKWLIKNHPHDSICGCSIDQVHEDMKYRFSQTRQIGERLTLQATRQIAASIEGEVGEKDLRVVVFNPLTVPVDEIVDLTIDVPLDFPNFAEFFGFEQLPSFVVVGADGKRIPYQRNAQAAERSRWRLRDARFGQHFRVNEVRISLPLQIPALGYTALTVEYDEKWKATRYPQDTGLATSERSMENNVLGVRIESNGTLTITDKRTGEVYTDVLTFEERADIGDGWFHGVAVNDQIYTSTASAAEVAMIENGPNTTAFRIRTRMNIPAEFDFKRMTRSERRVDIVLDSIVRLRAGGTFLEVETTVDNTADDHRVRVFAPSGAETDVFYTDTPFDIVERRIALCEDNHLHMELEIETKPMQHFCAVGDGRRGLAIISTGQFEGTVRDLENRPVALTLFRGTRRTVGTDGEPAGQIRETMTFRYYIQPLEKGVVDAVDLFRLGQRISAGFKSVQQRAADQEMYIQKKRLPKSAGFFSIDGPVVVTSSRVVDGDVEVRLFNPADKVVEAAIVPGTLRATAAELVDFESNPTGRKLAVANGKVALKLEARRIATVRLT